MKRFPLATWTLIAGVIASMLQIAMMGPLLPERIASHFGASGEANGYMDRSSFLTLHGFLAVFLTLMISGVSFLLPSLPNESINLPNKAYFLAPERRRETLDYLISRMMVFNSATLLLITAIFQVVYEANIQGKNSIGWTPLLLVGAFLIYTTIWSIGLIRRFTIPQ